MWDDAATRAVAKEIHDEIVGNIRARRDANGDAYPPGRDLRETGNLLASFRIHANGTVGGVSNEAPYAAPVNAKVPFMGLPESSMAAIDRAVMIELARLEKALP